jgi:replicative DNA helicase
MTGGAKSEEMIVVAARPSMGKSSLLMGIAEHVSIECGKGVLVFSLEMNYVQLAQRAVLGRAHINIQRVRDGFFSRDQFDRTLPKSSQEVAAAPIWIDDTPGLSIQELRARARRFVKAHPEVKAIFVDYLQLLRSTTRRNNENREREIAEISGGLKVLARQLKMPVFTAAQLNRENDGANSKPKLSNLRESGTIEQDADVVLLLHRRYYYTEDAEDRGKATVFLAKQRNGPTGEVELTFWDEFARFENPANEALYSNDPRKRQGWKEGDAND